MSNVKKLSYVNQNEKKENDSDRRRRKTAGDWQTGDSLVVLGNVFIVYMCQNVTILPFINPINT